MPNKIDKPCKHFVGFNDTPPFLSAASVQSKRKEGREINVNKILRGGRPLRRTADPWQSLWLPSRPRSVATSNSLFQLTETSKRNLLMAASRPEQQKTDERAGVARDADRTLHNFSVLNTAIDEFYVALNWWMKVLLTLNLHIAGSGHLCSRACSLFHLRVYLLGVAPTYSK